MYIPTQEERYRKVAKITLFLCVMLPSSVVCLVSGERALMDVLMAFLLPPGLLLHALLGLSLTAAICISAALQGAAFWWLSRFCRRSPKAKITIAITWGMSLALLLRLQIAYLTWSAYAPRS